MVKLRPHTGAIASRQLTPGQIIPEVLPMVIVVEDRNGSVFEALIRRFRKPRDHLFYHENLHLSG